MSDWLKETGKEVAKAAGDDLKGMAKEKAVAWVKEQFGMGLADELKSAGKEVATAAAEELKGQAKKKALDYVKSLFSGAGTAEQAVKLCAYSVGTLRKAVTRYRRDLAASPNRYLLAHAKVIGGNKQWRILTPSEWDAPNRVQAFADRVHRPARRGGYSLKAKRAMIRKLRERLHP